MAIQTTRTSLGARERLPIKMGSPADYFARVLSDEKAISHVQFQHQAVHYYASLGVRIARAMTDNGTGYERARPLGIYQ